MTSEEVLREIQLATYDLAESERRLKSAQSHHKQAAKRLAQIYSFFYEGIQEAKASKISKNINNDN